MSENIEITPQMRGTLAVPEPDSNEFAPMPSEQFSITDFTSATWFTTRIMQARAYGAQAMAWAKAEAKKAENYEGRMMARYGEELRAVVEQATDGSGKKSLNLPSAKVGLRKAPVRVIPANPTEAGFWVADNLRSAMTVTVEIKANGEVLTTEKIGAICGALAALGVEYKLDCSVDKTALTNYFKETGELPGGCEIEGGDDRLYISGRD